MVSYRPTPARRLLRLLLAIAATCGVLAAGAGPASAFWGVSLPAPAKAAASHKVQFGVHTDGDPYSGHVRNVEQLGRRLRRPIDIVSWYQQWRGEWISQVHQHVIGAVTNSGRTPLLTWEPWDPNGGGAWQADFQLQRIARGEYDWMIRQWADGLAAAGSTIYLRPMHEMNGNWYPWGGTVNGNTTRQYRAAWRRIHRIFGRRGADNVRFVWSPLNVDVPATRANRMERYYPGDRYVDVLALDGYNWGAGGPGGWASFRQVFEGAYRRIARIGPQPIWIAEVGSAPGGGDKAAWVRDMWRTAAGWRRLKAIVWFDLNKERDWRTDSTPAVAKAFTARR
jgi:beta-mannanase